jgi:hypothetical protein
VHQGGSDSAVDPHHRVGLKLVLLALATSARLIASQVSGRIALMVRCSSDFFGEHASGSWARRETTPNPQGEMPSPYNYH